MAMAGARVKGSERAALVAAARLVAEHGLVVGSAGNLSLRAGDDVLITPAGARLEAVDPRACVEVRLSDSAVTGDHAAGSRPSSELPLHIAVYAATEAGAIVHTHSHYATVLSTIVDELPAVHYAIRRFGGPVRVARYETFGTDALAAAVSEALEDRRAALMANHGAVVTAQDIETAVAMAIDLEWLASVYYHAMLAGTPRILTESQLDAVRERARQLRYGAEVRTG
jgi:L-fuculose-phosphate aldolase